MGLKVSATREVVGRAVRIGVAMALAILSGCHSNESRIPQQTSQFHFSGDVYTLDSSTPPEIRAGIYDHSSDDHMKLSKLISENPQHVKPSPDTELLVVSHELPEGVSKKVPISMRGQFQFTLSLDWNSTLPPVDLHFDLPGHIPVDWHVSPQLLASHNSFRLTVLLEQPGSRGVKPPPARSSDNSK